MSAGMERALVIGASGGIGAALAAALAARGAAVTGLSRRQDGLDITDAGSVARILGALEGPFDAVILATGILAPPGRRPEKALRQIEAPAMAEVLAVNAIGPALVLAQVPRLLPRDRRAVVGVLSARVGSIGDNRLGGWHSYRASKAALNQIVRCAAIEIARSHPKAVVAALHPGTVATPFTAAYRGGAAAAAIPPETAAADLLDVLGALGPADSGGFFDRSGAAVAW
jgi:NAD(P)-dependent dehydrogenase (short-subunit alcohol dehydrogenase family)